MYWAPSSSICRCRPERSTEDMTMSSKTATETLALGAGRHKRAVAGISSEILIGAIGDSFRKLNPRTLIRNPVMFVVEIVSALTTIIMLRDIVVGNPGVTFTAQLAFWLWFT